MFNRKSTAFAQALHRLEERVKTLGTRLQEEKTDNRRNVLEFAELAEKMRRTYLRLSRIVKVDSPPTSLDESDNSQPEPELSDPQEIRDRINRNLNL